MKEAIVSEGKKSIIYNTNTRGYMLVRAFLGAFIFRRSSSSFETARVTFFLLAANREPNVE